jgi:hypothetical protein
VHEELAPDGRLAIDNKHVSSLAQHVPFNVTRIYAVDNDAESRQRTTVDTELSRRIRKDVSEYNVRNSSVSMRLQMTDTYVIASTQYSSSSLDFYCSSVI